MGLTDLSARAGVTNYHGKAGGKAQSAGSSMGPILRAAVQLFHTTPDMSPGLLVAKLLLTRQYFSRNHADRLAIDVCDSGCHPGSVRAGPPRRRRGHSQEKTMPIPAQRILPTADHLDQPERSYLAGRRSAAGSTPGMRPATACPTRRVVRRL
jgi:hypothetical protein